MSMSKSGNFKYKSDRIEHEKRERFKKHERAANREQTRQDAKGAFNFLGFALTIVIIGVVILALLTFLLSSP